MKVQTVTTGVSRRQPGGKTHRAKTHRATRAGIDAGDDRGAAMVEFAITSILLAILIFGIIEGGLGFRAKLSLSNAADSAARRGSIVTSLRSSSSKPTAA